MKLIFPPIINETISHHNHNIITIICMSSYEPTPPYVWCDVNTDDISNYKSTVLIINCLLHGFQGSSHHHHDHHESSLRITTNQNEKLTPRPRSRSLERSIVPLQVVILCVDLLHGLRKLLILILLGRARKLDQLGWRAG